MRYGLSAALAMFVVCAAAVASAGPLDKNAGSKINGDAIGTPAPVRPYRTYAGPAYNGAVSNGVVNNGAPNSGTANRSFSYAPAAPQAPVAAAPSAPQTMPAPPVQQAAPRRSYSYSNQPMQRVYQAPRAMQQPSYLRPDRKARFDYH